ncbi:MAG: LysM peptidoglycan-binding domain-containing protein [Bacteroidetes bacterium]|nr:LysM peptidoglycan-binding domain-containing protein [Bacteroidota bacterium]
MKIIYFVKILQRHVLLLILVPLLLAAIVFFLTRKNQWSYVSEATIYTGVTSGYSVQQQAFSDIMLKTTIYDNLINLIRSRQTLEEVSASLLAQHLLLDNYDDRYISKEHWDDLIARVPPDVMDIVRKAKHANPKFFKSPGRRTSFSDTSLNSPDSRINSEKTAYVAPSSRRSFHVVAPGETMFSIARSYGMTVSELMSYNRLRSNHISTGQKLKISAAEQVPEPAAYPTETGNIEPAPVRTAGSERLVDSTSLPSDFYSQFDTATGTVAIRNAIGDTSAFDKLVKRLINYGHQNDYNFIYQLWNSTSDPFYSLNALSTIEITRIQSSDLLKLSYKTSDPGIAQQTLVFLIKGFIRSYKLLKQNQTDAVIAYFRRELDNAMGRLQKAESALLVFNSKNNIINFYEQTKVIATTKEELDVEFQNKQIALASSDAAIKIIEKKLENHAKLSLNTSSILRLRNELTNTTMQIANLEIDLGNDSATIETLAVLKGKVESIKAALKDNLDQLYLVTNSVEGLPLKDLLNAWLTNVVAYEESKAALRVLSARKIYFQKVYEIFAPLGAQQKRFERLIGVTESEFLELLHDLNLAKLRQQDDELSTNLKIVDSPFYPLHPLRSKVMLLVLAAALLGFLLVVIILLAMEFFDTTIKTPERAERFIKLKLAGVYPKIVKQIYNVDIGFILPRLVEIIAQNIKLNIHKNLDGTEKKPAVILFISTRDSEGKTTIGRELTRKFRSFGENALFLNYLKENATPTEDFPGGELIPPTDDELQYIIQDNFFETKDTMDLLKGYEHIDIETCDYIFIEIPSLINNAYPIDLIKKSDYTLLVVRANRSWTDADKTALNGFLSLSKEPTQIVLNGVELMFLDSVFGEIPKQRSKFRRTVKKILTFRFREDNVIS